MSIKTRDISETPMLEQITDNANLLIEKDGVTNRFPAKEFVGNTDTNRHAEYFDITDEGVISLKPEYRGAPMTDVTTSYPYAVSDRGYNEVGSKNNELPENLIIPEIVNEIPVFSFCEAMFFANPRVKSITIPKYITELPKHFARQAVNLHTVNGTENVKKLGMTAFYATRLEKANFPNLEILVDRSHFMYCTNLKFANIGSKITAIPEKMFGVCESLSSVYGGESVTSVGNESFNRTRHLRKVNFLPNLTNIGNKGFCVSCIDYDWSSLTNCTFGTNATVLQCNPTDFWSGCTYTPCNTPLKSVFAQNDPRWANNKVGNLDLYYGEHGCNVVSSAMVYSAFENKELSSPEEFTAVVRSKNSSLMDTNFRNRDVIRQWLEAVGYTAENVTLNAEGLQKMYNALATGSLIVSSADNGNATNFGDGHTVVIHGINEKGEVLVQDPSPMGVERKDYTCTPFAMDIQKFAKINTAFTIVSKPQT